MAQLYKAPTSGRYFYAGNIAIVTVGLPARGKTYLAQKLCRYLRWTGIKASIFSVGDYRRKIIGTQMSHEFFNSATTLEQRTAVANKALDDVIKFINSGGQVAIYDASNTEEDRRQFIHKKLFEAKIQVLFIETICDKEEVIESNIREVKLSSPDYAGMDAEVALADFLKRIDSYIPSYKTIDDDSMSYIKDINVGDKLIVNKVRGYLPTRIVYYLMNLHIVPRKIYICINGESLNDALVRSDAPLSPRGSEFSIALPKLMDQLKRQDSSGSCLKVWTSPRRRSEGTSSQFPYYYKASPLTVTQKPTMVEMHPGAVDGMSEEEIKSKYPEEFEEHQKDPFFHRYLRGESYHDLAIRLESVLLELEREKDDVLIIAHITVLRCIYAYFLDLKESEIPFVDIPRNSVIELTPVAYGCKIRRHFCK